MVVSLDTNVWIFGLTGLDANCEKILESLKKFVVLIPDQIRAELERNLDNEDMRSFYHIALKYDTITFDFAKAPKENVEVFWRKGLKKGDAEIAAFCESRGVEIVVSDNRDFLSLFADDLSFEILSPKEFCQRFGL